MPKTYGRERKDQDHPYKSIYSPNYINAPQYITELICQKWARLTDIGVLPQYFWRKRKDIELTTKQKKIQRRYGSEIRAAQHLLKTYSATAIIKAINNPRAKWIQSLWNKKLIPIIEWEQSRVKKTEFVPTEEREVKDSVGRPKFGKKNPLRDL